MSQSLWEQHTSARGTPRLEGHLGARDKIRKLILDFSKSYLVYIYGSGGIGKTRLVQDILKYPPETPNLLVADQLIDLYHTRNHSLAGLVNAFLDVIPGFKDYFREQLAANEKWEKVARLEQEGLPLAEIISLWQELTEFFLQALNQFKGNKRLVIALDTAERLLFADQPIQEQLGIGEHVMPILDWLLNEFLPRVENAVVLLAGRPEKGKLLERLQQIDQKKLERIELKGLSEEESFRYFDGVAEAAEEEGDALTSGWIRSITTDQRKTIYENLCEYDEQNNKMGVRPIQLSLVIDNYVVSGKPPVKILKTDMRGIPYVERRNEFEKILVAAFQNPERSINEVLRLMALMPKGLDADFLKKLLEIDNPEERLKEIHPLSFVKVRPSDARVFLHDEVYDLLSKHLWRSENIATTSRIRNIILMEYKKRIDAAKERLADLYKSELALKSEASVEHTGRKPKPSDIIEARADLQNLLVEHLHYALEQNPEQGFETYYHYAEEAVLSNDESLDIQLRAELLTFLQRPGHEELAKLREKADADAAIRWVKRFIREGKHVRALELVRKLKTDHRKLLSGGGVLAAIELDVWEALALTRQMTGIDRAAKILHAAIAKLNKFPHSLQRDCALARAYNNLGYLLRSQGKYYGADRAYKKALPLWRQIYMEVEQANTLTNHAFVHSEIGNFESAWAQAWDGLKLRERQGRLSSVILSLNTLAHVRTQDNALDDSLDYIKRALQLTEQLPSPRARGLALIEASEAYRRISEWDKYYQVKTKEYLELAIKSAEEAIAIFSETVKEPERLVRSMIELGCAYRDWAKYMRDQNGLENEETQRLAEKSEEVLKAAVERAEKESIPYLRVDALVNLAWLYYYMRRKQVEETINKIYHEKKGIPAAYKAGHKAPGKMFKIRKEEAVIPFLTLLGKAHLVKGQLKFAMFEKLKDEKMLKEAVENYTLSLAYFSIYGDYVPREMRKAQERIHKRVKTLNIDELKKVRVFVKSTEKKYNLRARSRMWQLLDEHGLVIGD